MHIRSVNKLSMSALKIISVDRLPALRDLYKVEWPLHISTFSTIQIFIDRFARFPEWIERVSFLGVDEDWETCGAFVMINENRVFFNTLEAFPFVKLEKVLFRMEFESSISFVNIRDALRPVLLNSIRVHHFEIVSDIGTRSFRMLKEDACRMKIE